jgi:hypothetical protein
VGQDFGGIGNTAVGARALQINEGVANTAIGEAALQFNQEGDHNTAIGDGALQGNDFGAYNTAVGDAALFSTHGIGTNNIALGSGAGFNLTTGSYNIDVGNVGVAGEAHTIRIGTQGTQVAAFIAGIYNRPAGPNPLAVMCGNNGKLSALPSSRRFKHDIKPIDNASEAILALKPVSFCYDNDSTNTPWLGLIAEDVAHADENLIVRDDEGKPFGVRYDQVNAMLLNEFLKEHKMVQEQGAIIARQQKQIEALTAGLQKVSAQVELNQRAPQRVVNNR